MTIHYRGHMFTVDTEGELLALCEWADAVRYTTRWQPWRRRWVA